MDFRFDKGTDKERKREKIIKEKDREALIYTKADLGSEQRRVQIRNRFQISAAAKADIIRRERSRLNHIIPMRRFKQKSSLALELLQLSLALWDIHDFEKVSSSYDSIPALQISKNYP
ncbi:hypothetical protein F511_39910 [Dorcoceras hygrometricum]|uniref:Uncharacterized protein n=1 Tax=Dorcoceras hygrometricum TaxID=472368 RepID=A0A2Z7BJ95_9LAMI|nr:hypothetical protein F511_39910 [Dorcoceras hygrometricum]